MGDHTLDTVSWWARVRLLEPARVRAVVASLVAIGVIWGLDVSPWADRVTETWALIFPLLAVIQGLVQGEWTRTVVSPSAVNGLK